MGATSSRLFAISLCITSFFLMIGCQGISPQQLSSVTPNPAPSSTPTPTPVSLKQPKFLFAAGRVPGGGEYQVFTVNPATGELQPISNKAFDAGIPKEIMYESGTSSLYASVEESELMNLPGLHSFHFDSAAGSLSSTGEIDMLGDWSSAATPNGKTLYLNGFHQLSRYLIDNLTGTLIPTSSSYPTDSVGQWMLKMHPSGRFLYGNGLFPLSPPGPNGSNAIYHLIGFIIDPNSGTPAPIAGFPQQEALNGGIAIHPSGNFIVAAGANQIYSYQIDPNSGAARLVSSAPFDGRNFPDLVPVVEPSGRYVYLCCAHNQLFAFQLDSSSGNLTPLSGFPINVIQPDLEPEAPIAVSGSYLFLGQGQSFNPDTYIAVFKIREDGSLSPAPGSPFKATFGIVKALTAAEE
jgi:6-phosphogluconolactonase (cycloisomerase 2 family)